ncbi:MULTISPECIES: M48 family metallopeptidase [Gordonia]|uniref:M48 family metallopeptidase n=1 Tax=Gordonia TaxID=2053 RepID=UPI0013314742|nr:MULTISPECIES: SprT family zinc-dependent metalloprotease [Gordonia]KAF0971222.1 hypothetical protein BPODLACK_00405 [Gordonia sp. YY1]MCR8899418.1 M48 family metallopeptidase [Gordonia sp. GONU]MCZ4651083.1 SprT family zinc-dependent metalloprotease [Gordonia amicalis]
MSTTDHSPDPTASTGYLTVRDIEVDVEFKDVKNLHIAVEPPLGRVRVAAPPTLTEDQVRLAVLQRYAWIRTQRDQLRNAPRQSEREMTTGESHYVWGRRLRLALIERPGRPHFEVSGGRLLLYTHGEMSPERHRQLLDQWYRQQLRHALPPLIETWEQRLGLSVPKWSVRKMKTKWGSCNRETRHIWFNVELAKKQPECLEYIVVHEMTHYLERGHGQRFVALMDVELPDWRNRRSQLNEAPLADEEWRPKS